MLSQEEEKIETEISTWIRDHGIQSNSMTFTFLIPIFQPDLCLLEELIEVIQGQTYTNWEVLFVADGIESANLVLESQRIKKVISQFITPQAEATESSFTADTFRLLILSENIGTNRASLYGIANARGSHIVFVDQDDLISANTLEVFSRLGQGEFDAAYSDHRVIDLKGNLLQTFRKPDWSPILATQVMYFGHIKCFKRTTAQKYYREIAGSYVEDHIAMLNIGLDGGLVLHAPLVLGSWRQAPNSLATSFWNKPIVSRQFQFEITQIFTKRQIPMTPKLFNISSSQNRLSPTSIFGDVSVQIVIPTMWKDNLVLELLSNLLLPSNIDFRVTLIDTLKSNRPPEIQELVEKFPEKLHISDWNVKFNYSKVNNEASKNSQSEYLLFLNDDVLPLTNDWLEHMIACAHFSKVGAVGAQLLYPTGNIQHGGIALGLRGTADHMYRNLPYNSAATLGSAYWTREVSAVTAACILIPRIIFEEVAGFDESYSTAYQDVDICLKISQAGYSIVQSQSSILLHYESASRGSEYDIADRNRFIQKWMVNFKRDPFVIEDLFSSSSRI
jgi:glycosyltransferase involved in cell wall biosynthesis